MLLHLSLADHRLITAFVSRQNNHIQPYVAILERIQTGEILIILFSLGFVEFNILYFGHKRSKLYSS